MFGRKAEEAAPVLVPPGVCERVDMANGEEAVTYGVRRLHRSARGCPIVDISQLEPTLVERHSSTNALDDISVCLL